MITSSAERLTLYSLGVFWQRREEKLSVHLSLAVAEPTASFNLQQIDQIDFSPHPSYCELYLCPVYVAFYFEIP